MIFGQIINYQFKKFWTIEYQKMKLTSILMLRTDTSKMFQ